MNNTEKLNINSQKKYIGYNDFEKACDLINRAQEFIFAVDQTSTKEYLEVHGVDPLYRHWIRLSYKKLKSNNLNLKFSRIYIFQNTPEYFEDVIIDYLSWKALKPIIKNEYLNKSDEIKEYLSDNQIYVLNKSKISEFITNDKIKLNDTIDAIIKNFITINNPYRFNKKFNLREIQDSKSFFDVLEQYRLMQVKYYTDFKFKIEKITKDKNTETENLRLNLKQKNKYDFFVDEFIYKDFLITEEMIYDYINPIGKLGKECMSSNQIAPFAFKSKCVIMVKNNFILS